MNTQQNYYYNIIKSQLYIAENEVNKLEIDLAVSKSRLEVLHELYEKAKVILCRSYNIKIS